MNMEFSIPIEYIRKYAQNETTSKEVQEFVFDMISDWESEDDDVYEHYEELEKISANGSCESVSHRETHHDL